jgi:hypothetical protein
MADQCISTLKEVVKSNTYIIVGMSQSGQRDRREMISVLGLNKDQAEIVNLLDVGQGIVRLGGRFPFPLLITFPFVKPENISDKELDDINSKSVQINDMLRKVKPVSQIKQLEGIPKDTSEISSSGQPNKYHQKIHDMLLDIYNRFDVSSTMRVKDLNLSASAGDKIFKHIEREQLAEPIRLNLSGKRGGISKYYVLTNPKGYEAISRKPPKKSGGTGPIHFFLSRYLMKNLKTRGFSELEIEKNIGGKRIDLFGKYHGLKIGIEICVSTFKTEHVNIQKDHDKCDILIITTPDKKTKTKLDAELSKREPTPKVRTCVTHELLNDPEKIIFKSKKEAS